MEKVTKKSLTIISKPHAHPHTMKKTYAKFQNDRHDRHKTGRGVALTRNTHCLYIEVKNDLVLNVEKATKIVLTIIFKLGPNIHIIRSEIQTTCTSSYMKKTHAKFQKDWTGTKL